MWSSAFHTKWPKLRFAAMILVCLHEKKNWRQLIKVDNFVVCCSIELRIVSKCSILIAVSTRYHTRVPCSITWTGRGAIPYRRLRISDVKFHEIFCPEIFHEIFLKNFKNFTMLFSGFTLTRLTFFMRQTLPFIHLCILQLPISLSAGLLASSCLVCF